MPQYDTKDEVNRHNNIYRNMYKDTSNRYTTALHLLLKWKGSVAKLIGHIFFTWIFLYSVISCIYRNILIPNEDKRHRQMFELICVYANRFLNLIPITFLIGFYVSQVVSRWWDQFMSLPWPDFMALKLANFCPGHVSIFVKSTILYYLYSMLICLNQLKSLM